LVNLYLYATTLATVILGSSTDHVIYERPDKTTVELWKCPTRTGQPNSDCYYL